MLWNNLESGVGELFELLFVPSCSWLYNVCNSTTTEMVSINAILRRIVLQFRDRGFADVSDANMIVVIMGNTRVLLNPQEISVW